MLASHAHSAFWRCASFATPVACADHRNDHHIDSQPRSGFPPIQWLGTIARHVCADFRFSSGAETSIGDVGGAGRILVDCRRFRCFSAA